MNTPTNNSAQTQSRLADHLCICLEEDVPLHQMTSGLEGDRPQSRCRWFDYAFFTSRSGIESSIV